VKELKTIIGSNKSLSSREKFKELYTLNPDLNKKEAAELLNVSRQQIYNFIKEM